MTASSLSAEQPANQAQPEEPKVSKLRAWGRYCQQNYKYYLLSLLFLALGIFDVSKENLFLTFNYRLPFFAIGLYCTLFVYIFIYLNAKLCPTQSLVYRKLALTTSWYFIALFIGFFMARDHSKAQLLIYSIAIFGALLLRFRKDGRLGLEADDPAYLQAQKEEKFDFHYFFYPFFVVGLFLQVVFYFYVDIVYQIYFNPFVQVACGLALANLGLILCRTRLDNFKHLLLILELGALILGVLYFFIIAAYRLDIFQEHSLVSPFYYLCYLSGIVLLAFINLIHGLSRSLYKGWIAALYKSASIICYLGLWYGSYLVVYR